MKRRLLPLLSLVFFLGGAYYFGKLDAEPARSPAPLPKTLRIASLSPAITDTIVALGAESSLVLVSDYCRYSARPRAGTIFSPRFERIASERPTLILATLVAGSPDQELKRLGPLLSLPWTTLEEVTQSTQKLGEVLHEQAQANSLAERLRRELGVDAKDDAPRVLALMGPANEDRVGYYYIKHDSLHGRLLSASGYRNAMGNGPTKGQPHLSVEQVLRVDPDAILVLQETPVSGPLPLAGLAPLGAVQKKRTAVLSRTGILSMGPDLIEIRHLVQDTLDGLFRKAPL